MLEVFVDWNCYQQGGIYRYFLEILPRISKNPEVALSIIGNANDVVAPPQSKETQQLEKITPRAPWFPDGHLKRFLSSIKRSVDQAYWKHSLKKKTHAIYHPTHYSRPPIASMPEIITIHDLIPELFPSLSQGEVFDSLRHSKKEAIFRAKRILANSLHTKKDLCQFYGISPDRVDVTPLAVDPVFFGAEVSEGFWSETRKKHTISEEPFLLYVGARGHYKNFEVLLRALESGKIERSLNLVVAGPEWTPEEQLEIKKMQLSNRINLIIRPDEETLRALYNRALGFVYPSLYEGFGLPLLEAMAAGTPVVAANAGSIPEVAAEAALYFDPRDETSLGKQISAILDPKVQKSLIKKGRERTQAFSWDETAARTVEAYRKVGSA